MPSCARRRGTRRRVESGHAPLFLRGWQGLDEEFEGLHLNSQASQYRGYRGLSVANALRVRRVIEIAVFGNDTPLVGRILCIVKGGLCKSNSDYELINSSSKSQLF